MQLGKVPQSLATGMHFLGGIAKGEPHWICIILLHLSLHSDPHFLVFPSAEQEAPELLYIVPLPFHIWSLEVAMYCLLTLASPNLH